MKKMLVLLVAVISLCGCGEKSTSNTCSVTENGMKSTFKLNAKDDEINQVTMTMEPENSLFGVESLAILDDEQKEQVKSSMLTTLGLENDTYEGLEIDIQINDTMVITIEADLSVADKELLKKIGLDFTNTDMSLEQAVEDMKSEGYTCEK